MINQQEPTRRRIFLAEDNDDDIFLISRAIEGDGIAEVRDVAREGQSAVDILRSYDSESVDLVILDVNLPIVNGFEILSKIRRTPWLQDLPVVMFSSSSRRTDVDLAYKMGASAYVYKPSDYSELRNIINSLIKFSILFRERKARPVGHS